MSNVKIGERIRQLREIQNFSRENFAEKVDISSKFLYEIETGKKGFSADTLCRISQALSVSCDYIMFGEEKESRRMQEMLSIFEILEPYQINRMQSILKILYEMCNVV